MTDCQNIKTTSFVPNELATAGQQAEKLQQDDVYSLICHDALKQEDVLILQPALRGTGMPILNPLSRAASISLHYYHA